MNTEPIEIAASVAAYVLMSVAASPPAVLKKTR